MSFIRSLIKSGAMKLYQDFRTGSIQDLAVPARTFAVAGTTPKLSVHKKGIGTTAPISGVFESTYVANIAVPATSTGLVIGGLLDFSATRTNAYNYLVRTDTYRVYWTNTIFITHDGSVVCSGPTRRDVSTYFARIIPGNYSQFYLDGGAPIIGTTSVQSPAAPSSYVRIAMASASDFNTPQYTTMIIDGAAVSDADVARLHRELTVGPSVVARPTTHFSIPYPSKTPAEYAAEGIIVDLPADRLRSSSDNVGNVVTPLNGLRDVDSQKEGPFSEAVGIGGPYLTGTVNVATPAFSAGVTLSAWIKVIRDASLAYSLPSRVLEQSGMSVNFISRAASLFQIELKQGGSVDRASTNLPAGAWVHVVGVVASSGVKFGAFNGVSVATSIPGAYAGVPPGVVTNIGERADNVNIACVSVHNRALTPAEIRAEYLKGARKCLLDARVHSDGSCPVSLAAVGAGNELANGWKVQSGTWKVVEDAPVDGVAGKRWLEAATAGVLFIEQASAYGSWLVGMQLNPTGTSVAYLTADRLPLGGDDHNGYRVQILSTGSVLVRRTDVGGASTLFSTVAGFVTSGVDYSFFVTRRFDGLVAAWIYGGAFTDWTLVGAATDATHKTSAYSALQRAGGTGVRFAGEVVQMGEMTPFEAIKEGILDGEIPDPFWTVTTTDTSQSWDLTITAGAVYVFDWGDGQQTWHTGTGASQAIAHTYASAGTYTVRVYFADVTKIIRFYALNNALVGSLPVLDGLNLAQMQRFYAYSNWTLTGSIPSLDGAVSMLSFQVQNNSLTGYTASTLASSIFGFDASNNALTQTAVDQILADFLTNAAARPAAGTINLSGGTNSAPSAQGIADRLAFLAIQPGWTISVNS